MRLGAQVLVLSFFLYTPLVRAKPPSKLPAKRTLRTFSNVYRGLKPGRSTLKDALVALGRCLSSQATSNGRNYRFTRAMVNISGPDRVRINTISVDRDAAYRTRAGIRLGDTIASLRRRLPRRKEKAGAPFIYDDHEGVFYWHDGKRIRSITLAYQAYTW